SWSTSSVGRWPSSRVLRGGSFNNTAQNVRSANRNNNAPANRNNNNGFRPASTLRRTTVFVRPESAGRLTLRSVPGCKVQVTALCRAVLGRPGQRKRRPGGSGRPHGSKAPPGRVVEETGLDQHASRHRGPFTVRSPRRGKNRGGPFTIPSQCSEPLAP